MVLTGEAEVLASKTRPNLKISTTELTKLDLGSNGGVCSGMPATDRPPTPSHGLPKKKELNLSTFCYPFRTAHLTVTLLTWRIWWAPTNASKWRMGFNSVFKGLTHCIWL